MPRVRRTRRATAAATPALAAVLAGCSADQVGASGDQGYVSGSGEITSLPVEEREAPGEVSGETLQGEPVSLADYRGEVVVVNVGGSWCGPCRKEAPMPAGAARDLAAGGVRFLGITTCNYAPADAIAFERRFEAPYPSLYDPAGRTLPAFRGTLPLNAIPSTVVMYREGRVAARILGPITSESTFRGLVEEVAAA